MTCKILLIAYHLSQSMSDSGHLKHPYKNAGILDLVLVGLLLSLTKYLRKPSEKSYFQISATLVHGQGRIDEEGVRGQKKQDTHACSSLPGSASHFPRRPHRYTLLFAAHHVFSILSSGEQRHHLGGNSFFFPSGSCQDLGRGLTHQSRNLCLPTFKFCTPSSATFAYTLNCLPSLFAGLGSSISLRCISSSYTDHLCLYIAYFLNQNP